MLFTRLILRVIPPPPSHQSERFAYMPPQIRKQVNYAFLRLGLNVSQLSCDHVTPALRQLNWLPVRNLPGYRETLMSYEYMNNLAPPYLCDTVYT